MVVKVCPDCGCGLGPEETKCPFCGAEVSDSLSAQTRQPSVAKNRKTRSAHQTNDKGAGRAVLSPDNLRADVSAQTDRNLAANYKGKQKNPSNSGKHSAKREACRQSNSRSALSFGESYVDGGFSGAVSKPRVKTVAIVGIAILVAILVAAGIYFFFVFGETKSNKLDEQTQVQAMMDTADYSAHLGNRAANIAAGGYVLDSTSSLYVCNSRKILRYDQDSAPILVADGSFKNMNFWNGSLYFTDAAGGSIYSIESSLQGRMVEPEPVWTLGEAQSIDGFAICDDWAFALERTATGEQLIYWPLSNFESKSVGATYTNTQSWLRIAGLDKIEVLSYDGSSTTRYCYRLENGTFEAVSETRVGTGAILTATATDDAVIYQPQNGYLKIDRGSNGMSEVGSVESVAKQMIASGQAVCTLMKDGKLYWFNASTASFPTEFSELLDCGERQVSALGCTANSFVIVFSDGSAVKYSPTNDAVTQYELTQ